MQTIRDFIHTRSQPDHQPQGHRPGLISQRAARTLPLSILVKPVGGMGVAATQIGRICTIPDLARPDCTSVEIGGYSQVTGMIAGHGG
jgi:hypothetical protein